MNYEYTKDEIVKMKESLTTDQVEELVTLWGGNPEMDGENLKCHTICHNNYGSGSKKLYYYPNTHLFKCYTDCSDSFDIFMLAVKVYKIQHNKNLCLDDAVVQVMGYFGLLPKRGGYQEDNFLADWEVFECYSRLGDEMVTSDFLLPEVDINTFRNFPRPYIYSWLKEGISGEMMDKAEIMYESESGQIVIPHRDINNRLVGVRVRATDELDIMRGKYRPLYYGDVVYKHPLGLNLYNLNNSKLNIGLFGKVIVFEGEKSVLIYRSYFGEESDISVAVCGSALSPYQVKLLLGCGASEIVIAFDKQFKKIGDEEYKRDVILLKKIYKKYGCLCTISFMFDKQDNLLEYKDSPIDKGKEVFTKLYNERMEVQYEEI